MPRSNKRSGRSTSSNSRNQSSDWGMMDMVRDRPVAAAAAAAGAAAAGLFLWSKRSQISNQLSHLSDQIGEWTENMMSGDENSSDMMDDTAGLTTTGRTNSGTGSRSASGSRNSSATARRTTASKTRGMSETGGGNASLGAHSGGIGTTTTGSPSGRGRAAETENT